MGFLVAVAFLLLREYMEQRIHTEEDVEQALGIPALATLPHAEVPARSAEILAGPGTSSAWLAWRMLSEDSARVSPGNGAGPRVDH